MAKYYKLTLLTSIATALFCNILYVMLDSMFSNYKSEWLTQNAFISITLFMVLINAFIFAVLSLSIFLNHYPQVKNRIILNLTTWFIPPVIWIVIIFVNTPDRFDYSLKWESSGILILLNTFPYLVGLTLSYLQFRKTLNKAPISHFA